MLNPYTLLLFVVTGLLFSPPALLGQETVDQKIERLQYRFQIEDIDGIGELIDPIFKQVVNGEASNLESPRRHLIAMAAMKFHLATGDHGRAILPYLIARHLQRELEQQSLSTLVDPVDEAFEKKHLPIVFFSEENLSRFRTQFESALKNGVCLETELSRAYYEANPNRQPPAHQKTLEAIWIAKENPQPSDREILKLIDNYVSQVQQHPTLAQESLATAIEGLQRLKRAAESDQLRAVFRSQFPDSRRLNR